MRTEARLVSGPGQTLPPCPSSGEAMARLLSGAAYLAAADQAALTGDELAGQLRGYTRTDLAGAGVFRLSTAIPHNSGQPPS